MNLPFHNGRSNLPSIDQENRNQRYQIVFYDRGCSNRTLSPISAILIKKGRERRRKGIVIRPIKYFKKGNEVSVEHRSLINWRPHTLCAHDGVSINVNQLSPHVPIYLLTFDI